MKIRIIATATLIQEVDPSTYGNPPWTADQICAYESTAFEVEAVYVHGEVEVEVIEVVE